MTLSLINSNNDFDFVGWVIKTLEFYFRSVKFHYVEETHMMLVAFSRWWKFLQHLSTKDNRKNLLCWQLRTPTRTWKYTRCTMQMSYLYASDFPFKNFCKLAKQAETILRNWQKQALVTIKHCFLTHKLTRYQSREFSYISYILKSAQADIHSQREIEVLFSTL